MCMRVGEEQRGCRKKKQEAREKLCRSSTVTPTLRSMSTRRRSTCSRAAFPGTAGPWFSHPSDSTAGPTKNGTKKSWDFMRTHDSVSVLIFNTTSHCFVLVKQFRPAVYMCEWERTKMQPPQSAEKTEEGACEAAAAAAAAQTPESQEGQSVSEGESSSQWPPASAGVTYELCAGLVDKPGLSLEEIARQEVLEECGYDVPASKLKRITSYRSGVGVTGAKQTMFYAEVSDDNCVSAGGGEPREGELIEVVKVPLHEAMTFAYNERIPKTMGVIFSFIWFHNNMSPKYKISTNV